MESSNGGGSGCHRIKVIKYKECCRNLSPAGATISFYGCLSFVRSKLAMEVCATCGCRKSFHRRYESYRPAHRFQSLHCLDATAAPTAEAGQPVPPTPTRPPRPATPQLAPPQAAPPPTPPSLPPQPPTILKSSRWAEMDEKNKPLKKRKARFFAET